MNNSVLQQDIMRRVYFIHMVRRLTQPIVSELALIATLVFGETFFVSLGDVYTNAGATETIGDFFAFFVSAFVNTHFVVQAMTVGIVVAGAFLTVHLYRQGMRLLSYIPFPFFRLNISK